jgi:hypothetical protein
MPENLSSFLNITSLDRTMFLLSRASSYIMHTCLLLLFNPPAESTYRLTITIICKVSANLLCLVTYLSVLLLKMGKIQLLMAQSSMPAKIQITLDMYTIK